MKAIFAGFCVVLCLLVADAALAKGGKNQLTVTGPGLTVPIEIDDSEVLETFNPWGGLHRFLETRVKETEVDRQTLAGPYDIQFFSEGHGWDYSFSYYAVEGQKAGYVVLPDPLRAQGFVHPAAWYRASEAWSNVLSSYLPETVAEPESSWLFPTIGAIALAAVAIGRWIPKVREWQLSAS